MGQTIARNPYQPPTTGGSKTLHDLIGEPVLAGIWFRTAPLPWYSQQVGPGSIPVAIFALIAASLGSLLPHRRNTTEAMLGYSGRGYCARTDRKLYLVESQNNGDLTRVIREFPASALSSCKQKHSNSCEVEFRFESGECFTLYFNRAQSEVAALQHLKQTLNDS